MVGVKVSLISIDGLPAEVIIPSSIIMTGLGWVKVSLFGIDGLPAEIIIHSMAVSGCSLFLR